MNPFTSAWWEHLQAKQYARGLAPPPKVTKADEREGKIQDGIIKYLDSLGCDCYYVWHRMDKPTTCKTGTPDFIGWIKGKPFGIEVKRPNEKTKPKQAGELLRIKLAGGYSIPVWSVIEAVEFIEGMRK
jgi:hypothetical protein